MRWIDRGPSSVKRDWLVTSFAEMEMIPQISLDGSTCTVLPISEALGCNSLLEKPNLLRLQTNEPCQYICRIIYQFFELIVVRVHGQGREA